MCGGNKNDLKLIEEFYQAVLGETAMTDELLEKSLSPEIRKSLWEADYDDTYSWWDFRTRFQDGPSDESRLISIEPLPDHWYRVTYSDMGIRAYTDVKTERGVITAYRRAQLLPADE